MATYRKYRAAILVLILGCVGATASVQSASGAPAIGAISKPGEAEIVLPAPRIMLTPENVVIGIASFYEGAQETSSGEQYDPEAFTAAAQLEIRDKFGGIRFGKNYQPCYAIGEFNGRKIIVKFNDVGPLKPGRKFDLSRAAMVYFDQSLQTGLLPEFKMTPLPLGQTYQTGPVSDEQLVAMGIVYGDDAIVTAAVAPLEMPAVEKNVMPVEAPAAEVVHSDAEEGASISNLMRDDTPVEETTAAESNIAEPLLVFADKLISDRIAGLLRGWSRFLADANDSTPAGDGRERFEARARKDGKVEDDGGLQEAGSRHLLLI